MEKQLLISSSKPSRILNKNLEVEPYARQQSSLEWVQGHSAWIGEMDAGCGATTAPCPDFLLHHYGIVAEWYSSIMI